MKGNSTTEGTTGSPGRGDVVLGLRPRPLPSETIEATLAEQVDLCKSTIEYAQKIGKRLEIALLALGDDSGPSLIESVELYERMSKAATNFVRALDDLARLRSFMDGGPDSRPDLSKKGEQDLAQLVLKSIVQLGWRVVDGVGTPVVVQPIPVLPALPSPSVAPVISKIGVTS